jgi:hypothetical protein
MASGDKLTNQRLSAMWQIAATLNFNNASNDLSAILTTQPDGIYSLANMSEMANWLKWHLGKDGSLAKWFPDEVYTSIIAIYENFGYNKTAIIDSKKPPENPAGGSGECTCDDDDYVTPARTAVCFKWDFTDFIEQAAGSETGGTWTFSGLSSGNYITVWDDYATNESMPTAYLTVT